MRTVPARLAAFAAALLVVFGLAFGVGRATADDDGGAQDGDEMDQREMDQMEMDEMEEGG